MFTSLKLVCAAVCAAFLGITLSGCSELSGSGGGSSATTFDANGCTVQNGQLTDGGQTLCYQLLSGNLYYAYRASVLQAAGWNAQAASPVYIRDFSPSADGSVLYKLANGDGTWFKLINGQNYALYGGQWMTVEQYERQARTDNVIADQKLESDKRIMDIIMAPPCNNSYNGCA